MLFFVLLEWLDLSYNFCWLMASKKLSTCDHLMDNAPNTPNINIVSVVLSLQDLWCHVIQSSNYRSHNIIFIASSKIDELQKRWILQFIECHHDILWFEISMSDISPMQLSYTACYVERKLQNIINFYLLIG